MNPGIVLVCDPKPNEARAGVSNMLAALRDADGSPGRPAVAGAGTGWAAAAITPPSSEPTCGACIHAANDDLLIFSGEMLVPDDWRTPAETDEGPNAIAAAVLDRIRTRGLETLAEVDGAFCGAWYDHVRRQWNVFNDKLGLIPVFYFARGDRLIVGPKAWGVWGIAGEALRISEPGVTDLLRCDNMTGDHTLIQDVHWLEGGSRLHWSPGQTRTTRYWDFHYADNETCTRDQAIDSYLDALCQAITRQTSCESPLLLGISGGLDSRMFLGMCERIGRIPSCFTAGWSFSEDVRFGRRLARSAGAAHDWAPTRADALPDQLTQAIIATDGLHSARHMSQGGPYNAYLERHHGAVLLEGHFHGAAAGAYVPGDDDVAAANVRPHQTHWAQTRLHAGGDWDLINGLLKPELATESFRRWQARVDDVYEHAPTDNPLAKAEYTVVRSRSGRIDVLGTGRQRQHALVRSPASQNVFIKWHRNTPPRLRRGKQILVDVFRREFPRLARVQRTNCGGLPIDDSRWLRQWCWQSEKLHRFYTGLRHPWTRKWKNSGHALTAWTFETWRATGQLDILTAPDARVLNWVNRKFLLDLWDNAGRDPAQAAPLLNLATVETMIRWLEHLPAHTARLHANDVQFRSFGRMTQSNRRAGLQTCL